MKEIVSGIYRVDPTKVTPSKYISFFAQSKTGNLLFPCLASSSTFESSWPEIQNLGGVAHIFLGDMHFATKQNDLLSTEFDTPVRCSSIEEPDVSRKVTHVESFPFERHELAPGLAVIPTPGHRPGAVGYLATLESEKALFIGDSIWHNGKNWQALSSKANRKTMKQTLVNLESEDFDSLYCNVAVTNDTCSVHFQHEKEKVAFLRELARDLDA